MALDIKQAGRWLTVTTPLGEDKMILVSMDGQETMSRLFTYRLEMISPDSNVSPDDILGKNVTFTVQQADADPRVFNGICSRFYAGSMRTREYRTYHAEITCWLWFLTRTADCRIFQEMSVVDIIEEIFGEYGTAEFTKRISGDHPKHEYRVQYRETDFNFVSRLMEEEGIFYYFEHVDGSHNMVLADKKECYYTLPESEVEVRGDDVIGHISSFQHRYEFVPGKWAQRDYNFKETANTLECKENSILSTPGIDKYEVFDYPGRYYKKDEGLNGLDGHGNAFTKLRMEEEEARYHITDGTSTCRSFSPGGKFTVARHEVSAEEGKTYAIISASHSASDFTGISSDAGPPTYSNSFTCIPDSVPYRTPRTTDKPVVWGPQTAVVVGPSGEEIHCDEFGRVKVQFHWDRLGENDEKSSCWIRVSQGWAAKTWGGIFIPRIDMEVIVDFLEGDPDAPIVTGCVYNGTNTVPYELPGDQTRSTIKTRSSPDGGTDNFNELRFEDKKDEEEVYFHAEKDFNRVVENDDTLKVGFDKMDPGDQTIEIYNNRTETVDQGDETVTIKTGNRLVDIDTGNETPNVKTGNRETKVDTGNNTLTVAIGNRTTEVSLGKDSLEAMQSIELKCGASSIKLEPAQITIKSVMVNIQGDAMLEAKSPMTTVKGDAMLTLKGGITMIN